MTGRKFDTGKLRWSLLPIAPMKEVVKVLMFGAAKYNDFNWLYVDNAKQRYSDAALRHFFAYLEGEVADEESGCHPLAHTIVNALFALWFVMQEKKET